MKIRGVIEGFYGAPWSEEARIAVGRWCAERGMTHYVYAPKDDPKHRQRWREPYTEDELRSLERVIEGCGLAFGFAVSPGLSIDYRDPDDRGRLLDKLDAVIARGVSLVALLLDDIDPRPGLGEEQADLTRWLYEQLAGRAELVLVPTEYVGVSPSPYLDALAAVVPEEVPIGWTGAMVVNEEVTAADARARAASLGGRAPLLWDNYPVNDAVMGDSLFMGPLRGRSHELLGELGGWIANPMVQPNASLLPLASVAALLRGDDPVGAWRREAEGLGLLEFAEACDGVTPLALAARALAGDRAGMKAWLEAALQSARLEGPLAEEVEPWVRQLRAEVELCNSALRTLEAAADPDVDPMRVLRTAYPIMATWPRVRRGERSVLGRRFGFSPRFAQGRDATWRYDPSSLTDADNATDVLCRAALDALARVGGSGA